MSRFEAAPELVALLGDTARDVADRLRHRFAAASQRLRRYVQRLELRADAPHRLEEWRLQFIDVQRRRELIREAPNRRHVLDAIGGAFVVLELEQTDVAVAEAHWKDNDAHHFARP